MMLKNKGCKDLSKEYVFKNEYMKQLAENCQNSKERKDGIKSKDTINFLDIATYIKTADSKTLNDIYADINSGILKIGMDANTVDMLLSNKDNERVKALIENTNIKMSLDVDGLKDLSKEKFDEIQSMGVNIGKVYVNSGWDQAAARGYDPNVYGTIVSKAEKLSQAAMKNLPKNASEEQKFMALYNIVLKNTVYDHDGLKRGSGSKFYTSRNLEGFFIDGKSVCAGTADVLKQLCEMNGLEAEYVQGQAQSNKMNYSEYHAWTRVKIDGKWYNTDPTWDANKVKGKYGYCLKSDEDFEYASGKKEGHSIDRSYNPSYNRDSRGRSVSERDYESADYSMDSSRLVNRYYTDELDQRKQGFRHLTEEEAAYTMENNVPASAGTNLANKSVMQVFIDIILQLLNAPARAVNAIKQRFNSGKIKNIDATNANKIIKEELAKEEAEESFEDSIHVDKKKANAYKDKNNAKNDKDQDKGNEQVR